MTPLKWRRTSFVRIGGAVDVVQNDWCLSDGGLSIARMFLVVGGPQNGRWKWQVHVGQDGRLGHGGSGFSDTGKEAREACEAHLPEPIRAFLAGAPKSARERAARALCRRAGNPEDTMFEGRPMWMSYLDEADTALQAALPPAEWDAVRRFDTKF